MSLSEILREKMQEYTRDYGFKAGLDLLLMEIEADMYEVVEQYYLKKIEK